MAISNDSELLRCSKCKFLKPSVQFDKRRDRTRGRHYSCKACCAEYARTDHAKALARAKQRCYIDKLKELEPEKLKARTRRYSLKKLYGLTVEGFDAIVEGQCGLCAICGDPLGEGLSVHVDHDHNTGAVRSVLCHFCNVGLGAFRERPDILYSAIEYIGRNA